MLADPKVKALIAETGRIINQAISSSLPEEIPETVRYALEHNGFVFSGFKTYHSLKEVGLSLTTDEGKIKPYNAFLEDVHKIDKKYNRDYLYAEYNHAVGSTLMAAKWVEFEKDGDDYNLQYRTAEDERVREDHRALNGITLPPSDPFWSKYLPPNGWNCRCTTVQVRKEKYKPSDAGEAMRLGDESTKGPKKEMFRFNPGKTMEVFPPKHPYLPKGCGSCNRKLSLAWGQGKPECDACRRIFRQLAKLVRKAELRNMRRQNFEVLQLQNCAALDTGNLYYAKEDYKNLLYHCMNPTEVLVTRDIRNCFTTMVHVRNEELDTSKANHAKKIERGVLYMSVYRFKKTVLEKGQQVEKTFELKCEVRLDGDHDIEEHPYCLYML